MSTSKGEEHEPSFRVTDRRRVRSEDPAESADAPRASSEKQSESPKSPQAEAPPTEERGEDQEFLNLSTADLVRVFIVELERRALMHLGLIPPPVTRLVAKDLPQARLAIDCLAALVEQVTPSAPPGERSELEGMLAQLRLHFVQHSRG